MRMLLLALAFPVVQFAAELSIANSSLEIRLNAGTRGALDSVVDRASSRDFVSATKPPTLFRLTVATGDGKTRELTGADAATWGHKLNRTPSGEELVLRYQDLGGQDLDVECRVQLGATDTLSHWRIAVENHSASTIRSVVYPVVLASRQLGPRWEDDRLLSPGNTFDGELRRSQGPETPFPGGSKAAYPGPAQVQFLAYYDETAGLYLAAYDSGGNPKLVGFRSTASGIDLSLQHEAWTSARTNWSMPYEVVLGTFRGDWHAAADVYKQWALRQPWCSRKLTERSDISAWYLEGRPIFMFIPRAGEYYGTDRPPRTPDRYLTRPPLPSPGLRPRAPALFAEVSQSLHSPVVVIEYGWEKQGAWISPDVFPPYGGEESFREQVLAMKRNGHVTGCYISGTRWGVVKPGRPDYDGWSAFRQEASTAAVTGEDQKPVVDHNTWTDNVKLCLGSPVTERIMLDLVRGLVERGVSFVQYDQNIGGVVYECHNHSHPHPPGEGVWMSEQTSRFLHEARKLGKALDPDFVLTIEEPCEYFIQDVDGFNDRPYVSTPVSESVPLFSYVYHDYSLSFGGDSPLGLHCPEADLLRVARTFVAGLLVEGPSFGPSREWPKDELNFLAKIAHAQRTFAHDYVILGEMLPDPHLEKVPMLNTVLAGGTREVPIALKPARVPAVLASGWKSPAGKTGYALANVLSDEARPVLPVNRARGWVKIWQGGRQKLAVSDGKVEVPLGPREIALVEEE